MKRQKWHFSTVKFPLETLLPFLFLLLIVFYPPQSNAGKYDGEYSPSWSPDGKHLVYHKTGQGFVWDLVIENIHTGKTENITNSDFMEVDGAWSPDGSQLVYSVRKDNDWDIYRYDIVTGRSSELLIYPGKDNDPIWSEDGLHILFISDRSGISQIHQLTLATGEVSQLTNTQNPISHLSISDDGKYAVFDQFFAFEDKKGGLSKIYQLNLENQQIEHLYSDEASSMAGFKQGQYLYFSNNHKGNWDIYRLDINTGEKVAVIDGSNNEMKGVLDAKGKRIAFSYFGDNGVKVKVVKL